MGQFDVDVGAFAKEGQDRAAARSQALLGIIAQRGQAGAQEYAQGQAMVAQQGQAALAQGAASARGSAVDGNAAFANQESGRMRAISDLYRQDLDAGNRAFGQDMERQFNSNRDYHSQLSASLPLVAQNVQGQAQALGARAAAEMARREEERQIRELQMQAEREQIQAAREARAEARANRSGEGRTPEEVEYAQLRNAGLRRELESGPPPPERDTVAEEYDRNKAYERARQDAIVQLGGPRTHGARALQSILDGRPDKNIKTPKGNQLNWGLIEDLARRIVTAGF